MVRRSRGVSTSPSRVLSVASLVLLAAAHPTAAIASMEVIVMFRHGIPPDLNETLAQHGATLVRLDENLDFVLVATSSPGSFISAMAMRDDVEHAYIPQSGNVFGYSYCRLSDIGTGACSVTLVPTGSSPTATPNDPAYSGECAGVPCQWPLHRINVSPAWAATYGSPDVVVAVLDTGIAASHVDLAGNIMLVGTLPGINNVEAGTAPIDRNGHGTAVAGVLSAVTGNGIGLAGISQNKLLVVKVCTDQGACSPQHVAPGIAEASLIGADIISMSFGIPYDPLVERAINFSVLRDILLVAAVGNRNQNFVHFPASNPNVIAVSGTDFNSTFSMSNYGGAVEIAAPAGGGGRNQYDVYTTTDDGHYGYGYGTSIAAPHVSGVAALVHAAFPELSATEVRQRLKDGATAVTPTVPDPYYGYGLLDAGRALFLDSP